MTPGQRAYFLQCIAGFNPMENPNAPNPMYPMHDLETARGSLFSAYQHRVSKCISEGTFQTVKRRLEARIAELEQARLKDSD